jgi:hypothetical protein
MMEVMCASMKLHIVSSHSEESMYICVMWNVDSKSLNARRTARGSGLRFVLFVVSNFAMGYCSLSPLASQRQTVESFRRSRTS